MIWHSRALLAAVCLISGSMWLLPERDTSPTSELWLLTVSMATATVLIGVLNLRRSGVFFSQQPWRWRLVFSGIGSLGAPALLLFLGRQQLSSVMAVAIQASAPLLVALVINFTSDDSGSQPRLGPGLTALAGVLLVFPVALPASSHGWFGFCLYLGATCLSAASSVICHREMVREPAGRAFFVVAASNALVLLLSVLVCITATSNWPALEVAFSSANLIAITLSAGGLIGVVYLLRTTSPLVVTSRFILAPLIAALEAYVLLRPTLSFRALAGAVLMLIGGFACVRENPEQDTWAGTSLH